MVYLFSDFAENDLYVGQVKAAIAKIRPTTLVVDLLHNAPQFNPVAAAVLLRALCQYIPKNSIILAVVDPGVGTTQRLPVIVQTKNHVYVGPDNGLFDFILSTEEFVEIYQITWLPESLSSSFHARDLFAPVVAFLDRGDSPQSLGKRLTVTGRRKNIPPSQKIIYIDHFGNCLTGVFANTVTKKQRIICGNSMVKYAEVFGQVKAGELFWYKNSIGLVEIAANQASAQQILKLNIDDVIEFKSLS